MDQVNVTAQKARGFKKKPLRILVLAYALILAPLLNFFYSLSKIESDFYNPEIIWRYVQRIPPVTLSLIFVIILSGISLLYPRRYSWVMAISISLSLFVYNLLSYKIIAYPLLIFVGITLIPSVRQIYLNAQLRWWERAKRYSVNLDSVLLDDTQQISFSIIDLSESGFRGSPLPPVPQKFTGLKKQNLKIQIGPIGTLPIKWMRSHNKELAYFFDGLSKSEKSKISKLIKSLEAEGKAKVI